MLMICDLPGFDMVESKHNHYHYHRHHCHCHCHYYYHQYLGVEKVVGGVEEFSGLHAIVPS
jgi:hypothetical protein